VIPGLSRLLPLPLGLAGGAVGGLLWWLTWLLNPELWNELDEVEGYVIFGTIFLAWGLVHGCVFVFVPPFRATDPARDAVRYRLRRTLWLYALPLLLVWATAILLAVFLSQPAAFGSDWEPVLAAVIFSLTVLGTAWVTQEVCDWIQPRLPLEVGAAAGVFAIPLLAMSLGVIFIMATPYLWEMAMPRGNITAMDAVLDFMGGDLEIFTIMLIGPAIHGAVLGVMVPICEAVWRIPRPRRRDLGTAPWVLLAIPVLAAFDLLAVTIYETMG
jgi:hypothetical protein